jgi:hypothetical protein
MARYKVLKGVAHNIGHSFTSLMNYSVDDYTMGHILRFARETGLDTLVIDFMVGDGRPALLLGDPITRVPHWYTKMFWDMVTRSGSDRDLVQSATLTLKYDLLKSETSPHGTTMSPYVCDVSIVDNRGKDYSAHFSGMWYVDRTPVIERQWWNLMKWFRR